MKAQLLLTLLALVGRELKLLVDQASLALYAIHFQGLCSILLCLT